MHTPDTSRETTQEMTQDSIYPEAVRAVVRGEALRQWPQDLYIPPDALEIILESFEGPLDLLLYLIRRQNLDILDIPVAEITRQYMEYIELMRVARLDLAAEYLLMAAMLAEIKSRLLLPRPEEEEDEEDPRAALVRRLQEYERFREAAFELDQLPRLERDIFVAGTQFVDAEQVERHPVVQLEDLAAAFQNVLREVERYRNLNISRELLSVRERMTQILDKLKSSEFFSFQQLFDPDEGRMGLVVSFIAILELCKDDMLVIVQNEPFAPIHVKNAA